MLNKATRINDLNLYLSRIEAAIMATEKDKMLKHFVYKLNELLNL